MDTDQNIDDQGNLVSQLLKSARLPKPELFQNERSRDFKVFPIRRSDANSQQLVLDGDTRVRSGLLTFSMDAPPHGWTHLKPAERTAFTAAQISSAFSDHAEKVDKTINMLENQYTESNVALPSEKNSLSVKNKNTASRLFCESYKGQLTTFLWAQMKGLRQHNNLKSGDTELTAAERTACTSLAKALVHLELQTGLRDWKVGSDEEDESCLYYITEALADECDSDAPSGALDREFKRRMRVVESTLNPEYFKSVKDMKAHKERRALVLDDEVEIAESINIFGAWLRGIYAPDPFGQPSLGASQGSPDPNTDIVGQTHDHVDLTGLSSTGAWTGPVEEPSESHMHPLVPSCHLLPHCISRVSVETLSNSSPS